MSKTNKGWIKLYRQIQDSAIWNRNEPFDGRSAWIHLLMMANHEDRQIIIGNEVIDIKSGQFFTSVRKLADRFHWNVKRVTRYLSTLEGADMVRVEGTRKGTLLTIVNYGVYQGQGNTKGYTKGYTDGNTKGNTRGSQTRMKKNDKDSLRTRTREESEITSHVGDMSMDELELKLLRSN